MSGKQLYFGSGFWESNIMFDVLVDPKVPPEKQFMELGQFILELLLLYSYLSTVDEPW